MALFEGPLIPALLDLFVYVSYACMVIVFFTQKNDLDRIKFLVVVACVFFFVYLGLGSFPWIVSKEIIPWSFTQMAIIGLLAAAGIPLLVDRFTVLLLFIVYLAAMTFDTALSVYVGALVYFITMLGMINGASQGISRSAHENAGPGPLPPGPPF